MVVAADAPTSCPACMSTTPVTLAKFCVNEAGVHVGTGAPLLPIIGVYPPLASLW